eukprot:1972667-Pleurochrysis_carterae.AAC.1
MRRSPQQSKLSGMPLFSSASAARSLRPAWRLLHGVAASICPASAFVGTDDVALALAVPAAGATDAAVAD